MLGMDDRTLRAVWTIFLFSLLLAIVWFIRSTLVVFALAIFFAYMLSPIVAFVERMMPKRRNIALTVVYVAFVGTLVLVGFEVVPTISSQATNLLSQLPKLVSGKVGALPLPGFLNPIRSQIITTATSQLGSLQAHIVPLVQEAGSHILSSLSAVLPAILIPILAFFFLKDGAAIRVSLIGAVDAGQDRSLMEQILDDVNDVLRSYMRALVLLAIVAFIAWVAFLSIMQYPYDILLAGIAAVLEFIPVIGPVTALVIMVVVYLATGSGGILWVVVFWGVYRMFADYVLNPFLMSSGVELHPLLVLFGVLAGDSLAGVPGMFFSIPVLAILRVIYTNLKRSYVQNQITAGVQNREVRVVTPEQVSREVRPHVVQPGQSL